MAEEFMAMASGANNGIVSPDKTEDELTQMVMELSFENDYLKAHIGGIKNQNIRSAEDSKGEDGRDEVKVLHEKIECLNKEVAEQKETQKAAENALEHLRVSYTQADAKAQELSAKLVEAAAPRSAIPL